jgi:hypothetical protein
LKSVLVFLLGWLAALPALAQQPVRLALTLTDEEGGSVGGAQVVVLRATTPTDTLARCTTSRFGKCAVDLAPDSVVLRIAATGFQPYTQALALGRSRELTLRLLTLSTDTVTVQGTNLTGPQRLDRPFMETFSIRPQDLQAGPNLNIERAMTLQAGGTTSEFSSQYRIRGGNFDENLVYINGVEIYRPQLVRAGMQEGLPLSNATMAAEVTYSAGGFAARYGDKLSSVLDIEYRTPTRFASNVEVGLLTQQLTFEGVVQRRTREEAPPSTGSPLTPEPATAPGRLTYLVGARRLSLGSLLKTLDTQGDYRPVSADAQAVLTFVPRHRLATTRERTRRSGRIDTLFAPAEPLRISLLHITNYNNFRLTPTSRETTFGTIQRAFRLFVGYIGEEQTRFLTNQTALSVDHRPSLRTHLRYTASFYRSEEDELTDVEGGYRIGDVSTNLGNDNFGEVVFFRGIGTEMRRARNFLTANVAYAAADGTFRLDRNYHRYTATDYVRHTLHTGLRIQHEWIDDRLKEWEAKDSAEYITLTDRVQAVNNLSSSRLQGYVQYSLRPSRALALHGGLRAHYWTLNGETVLSPRLQAAWSPATRPDSTGLPRPSVFQLRAAVGLYAQPAFYRELRDLDGTLNPNRTAQQSIHYILGSDYTFEMWGRPFKLSVEAYYKDLNNQVPFEMQNIRLRYYAFQTADGYALGADAKVNGQFIRGLESFFRLSYLDTRERVRSLPNRTVRRPTDQRIVASLFFQDELPFTRRVKVHVNLIYGTGMPYGPPTRLQTRTVFRMPNYQRVDIGLSYLFLFRTEEQRLRRFSIQSLWATLEVFNLLQRQNTISYNWVEDLYGQVFAVPNYLSQRLLNLRVVVKF